MTVPRPYPDYFPYGISERVPLMQYAADVNLGEPYVCRFGAPLALSTTGILVTPALTTGVVNTFTTVSATPLLNGGMVPFSSLTKRDGWGRGLTFVADGAGARTITVDGYDYLGSAMRWTGALNGTTPVPVAKAFAWITSIAFGAAADTVIVSVGYNNVLGLPYAGQAMTLEMKNGALSANAGTFVAALADATTATATNADVRGTYLPVTVIPDGVNTFEMFYATRAGNLHGNAQFAA